MGVRESPRPFQEIAQGFLPQFEAKPLKPSRQQAVSPETACLGPLFSRHFDGQAGSSGAAAGTRGDCPSVPPSGALEASGAVRCVGEGGGVRAKAGTRGGAVGLLRGLLSSGSLGVRFKVRPARVAAQGELSLAAVRVKRNDLFDADLELVCDPARPGAQTRRPADCGVERPGAAVAEARGGRVEPRGSGGAVWGMFWRRWFENRSGSAP